MASVQLQTTTLHNGLNSDDSIVRTGSRLWILVGGGADATNPNLCLWYSDNDGASWTKHSIAIASASYYGTLVAYQDSGSTWHLHVISAHTPTGAGGALAHKAIHTNVASGAPGALTTQANIDAGGTDANIRGVSAFVTNTATNPRIWVISQKGAGAGLYQTQIWYCATGTAADTATNWTTLSNPANNSGTAVQKFGMGASVVVGGNPRAVIIVQDGELSPDAYKRTIFDPTVATPALGTFSTDFSISSGALHGPTEQPLHTLVAKENYIVFGRSDPQNASLWTFYKSTDGVTWTIPTGWSGVSIGRCDLTSDGTDFWLLHADTYGASSTTSHPFSYRKITTSSDTLGTPTVFSDTNGNQVCATFANNKLFGVYRSDIASPYGIRTDSVLISATSGATDPAANTNMDVTIGDRFRLRIEIQEIGGAADSSAYKLRVSKNGGAYIDIATASGDVRVVDSPQFANGDPTTNILTGGTGTFVAGQGLDTTAQSGSISIGANGHTELEWSLQLVAGTVVAGDTFDFRVYKNDNTALNTYSVTPRITAQ